MKSATIFLVAVTVFTGLLQHSSAAPQWGLVGGLLKGTLDTVGKVLDKVGEAVVEILSTVKVLLKNILGKDILDIKSWIDELDGISKTLPEKEQVKVAELIAKVKAIMKKLEALVKDLLENADELTVETVEKALALLAQLIEKIKAIIKDLLSIIEAISQGEEDISDLVSFLKAIVAKVTKAVDNIGSNLTKVLEALLAKLKDAAGNKSEEFATVIAKLIQECNAQRADIAKTIKDNSATATDADKKTMDEIEIMMAPLNEEIENIHKALTEAATSGNKSLLQKLKDRIEVVIVKIKAIIKQLANLEIDNNKADLKLKFENLIEIAKIAIKKISEY